MDTNEIILKNLYSILSDISNFRYTNLYQLSIINQDCHRPGKLEKVREITL